MELIDTHCHLNIAEAFPDPPQAIEEAHAAGVTSLIVIGIDIPSSCRAVEIAENHEGVYASVGIHPNSSADYAPKTLKEVERLLTHVKVVALGEVGLDFHWDFATSEQQTKCLIDQLDLAQSLDMPVVFHCREAYGDLLSLLEKRGSSQGRLLFHCFSGNSDDASRACALGGHFGVDGPVTYPKAKDLRAILATVPRDRIVIETDSPYLAPAPYRGKPNRPAYLTHVNDGLAGCLGITAQECAALTTANANRFFRLS